MKNITPFQRHNCILVGLAVVITLFFVLVNCSQKRPHEKFKPPVAKKIPEKITIHGHTRIDNYNWLGERENPEVIEYLKAENGYTEKVMAHTEPLQETLFEEIKGRTKETDLSVPVRRGDYLYYERREEGKEFPIYARKRGSMEAEEEIILDVNELASTQGLLVASQLNVSPGQNILAFFSVHDARGFGTIRFKDLDTGEMLEDEILEMRARPFIMSWANDNRTFFYLRHYPVGFRWHQVYRHTLGTPPTEDVLVYEETDKYRSIWLPETKSQQYLIISTCIDLRGPGWEHRYLDADKPASQPKLFLHRDWRVFMDIDHFRGDFYFLTSDEGENPRLVRAPVDHTERENWEEVMPNREDIEVLGFQIFRNYLVVEERIEGLRQFRIHPWSGDEEHYVDFEEAAYLAVINRTPKLESEVFRYSFWSFTTPYSIFEYDMRNGEKVLLKREEVSGGFDPDDYISERLFVPARDNVRIPISIVYRKELKKDGSNPLLLMAYGAYGTTIEAMFDISRLSLLDRGFVYAIAHVRGGGMLGTEWYDDGKLLKKENTFTDFIDVAEYLIAQKYTNPKKLFATGRSAGGTLMGAVANMRPDLFRGIIADVPLVDMLTPRRDESDTRFSVDLDFGDPNIAKHYDYMLSYAPYDNVAAQDYPNMLVTTGLYDSKVPYWGPAKWVAKMRALKTDNNLLILKTDMEGGHSSGPKRYQQWRDTAFRHAFLLDLVGIKE